MFFFNTPTKKENEPINTPETEINESPYDYQKQVDFELDKIRKEKKEIKKRKKEDNDVYPEEPPTVITDKYSRPIFMRKNGDLVEVTTKTINKDPYFYENGDPVPTLDLNTIPENLSTYFDSVKKPRTNGGKRTKGKGTKGKRTKGKGTKGKGTRRRK